jgi:hypothetical protein
MRNLAVLTIAALALATTAQAQDRADPVQAAIAPYAAYQMDISELRVRRLESADALEAAIDQAVSHNREALARGWIAYGAQVAAQSPEFVRGVRDAADYYGREPTVRALLRSQYYASGLRGADAAMKLALDSAAADGARVIAVADRYQEMAYALQRQRWANALAPSQAARVQRVRSLTVGGSNAARVEAISARLVVSPQSQATASDPGVYGGRRFWDALGGAQVVEVSAATPSWRVEPSRGEAVHRMITLAALQALDAATENSSAVAQILEEQRSKDCLELAQLQLFQCMSAARYRYENAFCLGQHAMRDVGRCISAVAAPATAAMTPVPANPNGMH